MIEEFEAGESLGGFKAGDRVRVLNHGEGTVTGYEICEWVFRVAVKLDELEKYLDSECYNTQDPLFFERELEIINEK